MNKKTELLSPAGDFEALKAAVQNGADAVYIGAKNLSARKNAKNFTWEEIRLAARYCRVRGAKLYLALNTLMRPGEEGAVEKAVRLSAENGVDALIIQDTGVAEIAKRVCPRMPIHASTQLCAHSVSDVKALMDMGFSRVVLSRELSEKEIEKIYFETGCEIEAFVHGALCISFSGRCLMSSFIGGRSGNRGCCAQPCRKIYSAEGRNGYLLSPRDLCLAEKVSEMTRAGVVSFKIEGRMKSPEYVAVVTRVYRKALDGQPITDDDMRDLEDIFSRGDGFTQGYFSGVNTPELMNIHISNDNISSSVPRELTARAKATFAEGAERQRVGVSMKFTARAGENMRLEACDCDGNTAAAEGTSPSAAQKAPMTAEGLRERLSKTGGTPYFVDEFTAETGENLFAPASELNALRRDCLAGLSEMRGRIEPLPLSAFEFEYGKAPRMKQKIYASVFTLEQLKAAEGADRIIVPIELLDKTPFSEKYVAALPQIILDENAVRKRLGTLPKTAEVYSSTLGGLRLIREAGLKPRGDFGLNVSNAVSANLLSEFVGSSTLSPELNLNEIKEISQNTPVPTEVIAYGRQTVMVSRACIIREVRGRCNCSRPVFLKDRTGAEFPVLGDRETHVNTVLNSRPTFMADKLKELNRCGAAVLRLCFTVESAAETAEIIDMYRRGGKTEGKFTRGYYFG
ncbi:MAG: DUF3656 domain-containing protein [Clostridia bacterium]